MKEDYPRRKQWFSLLAILGYPPFGYGCWLTWRRVTWRMLSWAAASSPATRRLLSVTWRRRFSARVDMGHKRAVGMGVALGWAAWHRNFLAEAAARTAVNTMGSSSTAAAVDTTVDMAAAGLANWAPWLAAFWAATASLRTEAQIHTATRATGAQEGRTRVQHPQHRTSSIIRRRRRRSEGAMEGNSRMAATTTRRDTRRMQQPATARLSNTAMVTKHNPIPVLPAAATARRRITVNLMADTEATSSRAMAPTPILHRRPNSNSTVATKATLCHNHMISTVHLSNTRRTLEVNSMADMGEGMGVKLSMVRPHRIQAGNSRRRDWLCGLFDFDALSDFLVRGVQNHLMSFCHDEKVL